MPGISSLKGPILSKKPQQKRLASLKKDISDRLGSSVILNQDAGFSMETHSTWMEGERLALLRAPTLDSRLGSLIQ
jgi:hypothetical protein